MVIDFGDNKKSKLYTKAVKERALQSRCFICDKKFSEEETEKCNFEYVQTRRKNELFIHKYCVERKAGGHM